MDFGLRGKTALVTAASRGLGRAIAEAMAAEGASLLICARGEDALSEAREAIATGTGVDVEMVAADLSTEEGIARVWHPLAYSSERLGGLVSTKYPITCPQHFGQPFTMNFINSACVMNVSDAPTCFVSAAMRFRRLKSFRAVTTASRLVAALVNLMASLSSFSVAV